MEAWYDKPDAKFIFQMKLYTETLVTSKDPKVIHMMFLQVRGAARCGQGAGGEGKGRKGARGSSCTPARRGVVR